MFTATVAKASDLFEFAAQEEIADDIQDLVYHLGAMQHHHWWRSPCFTVRRNVLKCFGWLPEVELMVHRYMAVYDIEVLLIVTDEDAYPYL